MVLAGEKSAEDIVLNDLDWYRKNNIRARLGVRVANIDRETRVVIDQEGNETPFDKLILATGSNAFIPRSPASTRRTSTYSVRWTTRGRYWRRPAKAARRW